MAVYFADGLCNFVKVDKHESARASKKAELIENLKRLYPGVVSIYRLSKWLIKIVHFVFVGIDKLGYRCLI